MRRTLRLTRALVDKIPATIPDPGPVPEIADLQTDEARARMTAKVLASRPEPDSFWVFAFGSLIWNPDFPYAEQRRARVPGWQRSFCMGPDRRYRGNPENPGIMLSLDTGGSCEGVVFRLSEATLATDLASLIAREPPLDPEWVTAETEDGTLKALAFVNKPGWIGYVSGMTAPEIAAQIAPAVGMFGSMADYVHNTAMHLHDLGIDDPTVWQMQDLVAQELERL